MKDRRPCGHAEPQNGCHTCEMIRANPAFAALFHDDPDPDPPKCAHHRRDLTRGEVIDLELSPNRTWRLCVHPRKPLGPVVCPCMGCGSGCKGFRAE